MNKICLAAATAAAAFLLSACSTGSKYYQHDGPPSSSAELDTSSATPRVEHFYPASLRPYTVMGQRYVPVTSDVKMDQTGIASWYGKQFHGNKTAIGETYNMHAMSAAHPTMPLPSYARITNLENGRSVIVRVNDRGPFLYNRVMDLSYAAATALDYASYMREVVQAEKFTTCGGDGGCSICGGLGPFLGFLPCSPHCKPEVQEDNELNGDYDFYRPVIRVESA